MGITGRFTRALAAGAIAAWGVLPCVYAQDAAKPAAPTSVRGEPSPSSTPAKASEPSTKEAGELIAKAPPLLEGTFTTSDGLKIHFLESGKGPHVVLIHGFTSSARQNWYQNGNIAALAVNHHVVAIDCRNHGESDKPTPRGSGKASDVVELMDHLKIGKAHIAGYSMGGAETGQLLRTNPDRFITATFCGSDAPGTMDLGALNIPMMVINGEQDRADTKGVRVASQVKDHKRVTVPGRTHMNAPSHPLFLSSMVEWINGHDPK